VDDDLDVLESTQFMLIKEGYDVIPAKSGPEAIEKYKENKPDIVFLDIKMPVMDGYDVFFKIKELNPKAKIIFISAFAINDDKYKKARNANLLDLLKKPFSLQDMKKLIEKHT